ncbi:MAG: DUF4373 domain-containing protein [Aliarcobacter sp.]|jgi:uncharacterized membrane-anchored protein YjiN (DUF445 family)|nr:DUF4373 domain-containing protein [Aliarcobacter sp.]
MKTKDTYWFRHDSNAKDDYKCMILIEQLGCEGYGIFWILVETLREQKDYRYPFYLLGALARKYNTTQAKVETVVKEYGLFEIDIDSFFFSHSFNRRMENLDKIKEQRRIAGLKSGANRKIKAIEHKLNKSSTKDERVDNIKKEKIIKEINKLKDFLSHKSANAILQIAKNEDYKDLFSDEINSFILNNGGLSKIKTYLEDDNYQNWIVEEILKVEEK